MFKPALFKPISSISQTFYFRFNSLLSFLKNPYSELVNQAREVTEAFALPQSITWEYIIDETTGFRVLKTEKNPEVLTEIRQIADGLFK